MVRQKGDLFRGQKQEPYDKDKDQCHREVE